ncbi:hypothetical protein FSP39_012367 [Pinctada imbricata]|uniref:Uncharacterized protein n=1 Tax=Pinctada imbricata TaxID=66713 RepID=A0AA89BQQ3_PINIB|nr:hypothetical protein FSP39_012367 [Pinctada imbricata]
MASDFTGQELIQAAIYDDVDLLKCLLEGECMSLIDVQDRMGRTPVYTAVSNNSIKCLQVLLDSGADPNIAAGKHFHQMTPLHYALQDEKMAMVKWLLEHGADYNIRDASGSSPLDIAHNFGQEWIDIFENEMEFTNACLDEDVETMKKVLTECPSNTGNIINTKVTGEGLTPLCWACKCGNIDMVQFLLSNGADPKLPSTDDSYPVHFACRFEQIDCLRLLIENKHREVTSPFGSRSSKFRCRQVLLEYKYPEVLLTTYRDDEAQVTYKFAFDVNGTDNFGFAAIHMAAERRAREIIEYFVRFSVKSESNAKNRALRQRVNSNLIFSVDPGNLSTSQGGQVSNSKGLHHPVKINITGRNSYTPLHLAVKYKFLDITNILLKNGADVNLLANDRWRE